VNQNGEIRNIGAPDYMVRHHLSGYPTTRNGLKLYIYDIIKGFSDADASDNCSGNILYGWTDHDSVATVVNVGIAGAVPETFSYKDDGAGWAGPYDMSGYVDWFVGSSILSATANEHGISSVRAIIYYDT